MNEDSIPMPTKDPEILLNQLYEDLKRLDACLADDFMRDCKPLFDLLQSYRVKNETVLKDTESDVNRMLKAMGLSDDTIKKQILSFTMNQNYFYLNLRHTYHQMAIKHVEDMYIHSLSHHIQKDIVCTSKQNTAIQQALVDRSEKGIEVQQKLVEAANKAYGTQEALVKEAANTAKWTRWMAIATCVMAIGTWVLVYLTKYPISQQ